MALRFLTASVIPLFARVSPKMPCPNSLKCWQALQNPGRPERGSEVWRNLLQGGAQAHLAGSLDVEVIQPLQNSNPGHHSDGHVFQVAVQDLHDPIKVQGHWGPISTVGDTRREVRPHTALSRHATALPGPAYSEHVLSHCPAASWAGPSDCRHLTWLRNVVLLAQPWWLEGGLTSLPLLLLVLSEGVWSLWLVGTILSAYGKRGHPARLPLFTFIFPAPASENTGGGTSPMA